MTTHSEEFERLVKELLEASYKQGYAQAEIDNGIDCDWASEERRAQDAKLELLQEVSQEVIQEIKQSHYCHICGRTVEELEDVKP